MAHTHGRSVVVRAAEAGWLRHVPARLQRIAGLLARYPEERLAGFLERSSTAAQSLRATAVRTAGNVIDGGLERLATELHCAAERVRARSGSAPAAVPAGGAAPVRDAPPVHALEASADR